MFKIDKLPLFRPIINTIRYDTRTNNYILLYIPDNNQLADNILQLGILKQDIRHVYVPKIVSKTIKILDTNDYTKTFRKFGYIAKSSPADVFIGKNNIVSHIYDTSLYMERLSDRFRNNFNDLIAQKWFLTYIENIKESIKKRYLKLSNKIETNELDKTKYVIIYAIDTDAPVQSLFKNRRIYTFYKILMHNYDLGEYCDYFLLAILKQNKTIYIKLYDKNINLYKPTAIASKLKTIITNIKLNDSAIDETFRIATEKIINVSKKIENVETDKLKTAIEYIKSYKPELFNDIVEDFEKAETDTDVKKTIATIMFYAVSKNENVTNTMKNIDTTKNTEVKEKLLKNIINKYQKEIIPTPKIEKLNQNKLPVYNKVKIEEVVDKKVPVNIFEKRKHDFKENLFNDLESIIKTLEEKDYPIKLEKTTIAPFENKGEIKTNKLIRVIFHLKTDAGVKFKITLILPNIDETGSFYINGYKKILVNQLTLLPVFYPDYYEAKLTSYYSSITLYNKLYRNTKMYTIYIAGMKLPLSVVMLYLNNTKKVLNDYNLNDYVISDSIPDKSKLYIKFADKYLIFDRTIESDPIALSFFNSINVIPWTKFKDITIDRFLNDKEAIKEVLIKISGNRNAPFLLDNMERNFIDPITKSILSNMGYPDKFYNLLKIVSHKISTPIKEKRNALDKQRLRNVEIISQLFYQQLMTAYNSYYSKRKMGNDSAILEFDSFKVFKTFINNQLVRVKENICPIEQLSLMSRVTYVGVGGLKVSDAATLDMRALDDTAYGIIDPVDTPEGQMIGVAQNLANGTMLTDKRGIFGIKELDIKERSGILGVAGSFTPFVSNNEPTRMIMATNQAKQATILKNRQIPIVQTGYESLYTSLLDDNFVKKSPIDGVVMDVVDDKYIKIRSSANKIIYVDIKPQKLKSGQAVDCLSEFKPTVKRGDHVKIGDIVAEGGGILNGVISQGTTVLTGWFDYEGYTFEDGIVISEKLVNNQAFNSVHTKTIEVFLTKDSTILDVVTKGSMVKAGDPILIFTNSKIYEYADLDPDEIINRNILIRADYDSKIIDMRIYPNIDISKMPKLLPIFNEFFKEHPELKPQIGSFKLRGERFDGVILEIDLRYEYNLHEGDKIVNRHGSKGVIAKIVPEKEMPKTPWGEHIEICVNPLSIINRGILGQLYETYIGLISWKLGQLFINNFKTFLSKFKEVITILDNTDKKMLSKQLISYFSNMKNKEKEELKNMIMLNKMRGIPIIIPPFKEPTDSQIYKALTILGLKPKYSLYLPHTGVYTKEIVPVGYNYYYKVEHIVKKKMAVRSQKSYLLKTMQPPAGKSREGGQRVGEFDSWCLFSYDATNVMKEMFGAAADDIITKREILSSIVKNGEAHLPENIQASPTKEFVMAYLKALHITQ